MSAILPYQVQITRRSEKDIEALRPYSGRVVQELLALEQDPSKGHCLAGELKGARSLEFSLPGGAYRALYVVKEQDRTCLVFYIGPHEGAYRVAARRFPAVR